MNKALTKADIVEAVYNDKNLGRNRAEVKNIVENLLALMKQAIKKDDALLISGFGKFEAYDKNARKGRNPRPIIHHAASAQGGGVPSFPQVPHGAQRRRRGVV